MSKGIVDADGTPGPHFKKAEQRIGLDLFKYHASTLSIGAYTKLPRPYTTYAIRLPQGVPDTRFPANMSNGPLQTSRYASYDAYTCDPVQRFLSDVAGGRRR